MKATILIIILLLSGCSLFSEQMEELRQLRCADSSLTLCAGFETND